MDVREKLVELLDIIIQPGQKTLGEIADHLRRRKENDYAKECSLQKMQ